MKFWYIFFIPFSLFAKDLGVHGQVFDIEEKSLSRVIMDRLKESEEKGLMEAYQNQIQEKVKERLLRPESVRGITRTQSTRAMLYDPSITVAEDIKDHQGHVIVKKGTVINPLDYVSWGKPVLFLDGEDEDQVRWAQSQDVECQWVLIKGSPLRLQKALKRPFYFDQAGVYTRKFHIHAVPCRISQRGKHLLIEEIVINQEGEK